MSEPSGPRVIKLQDGETIKFLELYAAERLMYDPNCRDYKNRDLRLAAARRISEALAISGFGPRAVTQKFKNLRSAYCQELKKIGESEKSGGDVYVPKVNWFHVMNSFIRPFVQQRPTGSNSVTPTTSNHADLVAEEESQEITFVDVKTHIDSSSTSGMASTGQNDKPKNDPLTKIKRKAPTETWTPKVRRPNPEVDGLLSAINKMDEISQRVSQIPAEDSYDCFGKYIASMLRSIGPPTAMRLQEIMTRLVTEAMCPPSPPPARRQPSPNLSSSDPSDDF